MRIAVIFVTLVLVGCSSSTVMRTTRRAVPTDTEGRALSPKAPSVAKTPSEATEPVPEPNVAVAATNKLPERPAAMLPPTYPPERRFGLANRFFEMEHYDRAIREYRRLLGEDITYQLRGSVLFNLGVTLRKTEKLDECVEVFEKVLQPSKAEELLSAKEKIDLQNTRHFSCMQISMALESKTDFDGAIKYLELARDTHKYTTPVPTSTSKAAAMIRQRLKELKAKRWEEKKAEIKARRQREQGDR